MKSKHALVLILLILLIVFFLQNTDTATIEFLFWERDMTLAVLISVSTLIGLVLGIVLPRLLDDEEQTYKLNQDKPKNTEETAEA